MYLISGISHHKCKKITYKFLFTTGPNQYLTRIIIESFSVHQVTLLRESLLFPYLRVMKIRNLPKIAENHINIVPHYPWYGRTIQRFHVTIYNILEIPSEFFFRLNQFPDNCSEIKRKQKSKKKKKWFQSYFQLINFKDFKSLKKKIENPRQ